MHRPVGEQRQDRGAYVTAPRPAPRSAAATATTPGPATESGPERPEGGAPPLELLPTVRPAVAVTPPMFMSV
ncbi:hypothetical protein M444_07010 [Streptomyces sp. Mg1]|nr:hypothetical protein M444_07010 [Streptomyces sp. Mg1]